MDAARRPDTGEWRRLLVTAAACVAAGWLSFLVPCEVARAAGLPVGPTLVDGMQWITLPLLFAAGFAAGAAVPRWWFLWGPCIVAFLPCKTAIDIALDATSHNLWPFELVFYAAFTVLGAAGAGVGALARPFARWIGQTE